jgi:hypothetical protein
MEESMAVQRVCEDLVRREVVWNAGELVQFLLESDHFDQEDLYRLCQSVDREATVDGEIDGWDEDEYPLMIAAVGEDAREDLKAQCRELALEDFSWFEEYCNPTMVESEALEFWAVTKWFAEKLAEHGESTAEILGFYLWGRTCSGQSISMDGVIREIASEMEILPGQKNSWA